jgi:putative acetyltransferase
MTFHAIRVRLSFFFLPNPFPCPAAKKSTLADVLRIRIDFLADVSRPIGVLRTPSGNQLSEVREVKGMVIVAVSPSDEGARAMMRELDAEISALYPDTVIFGIDEAEFEKAGGYFVVAQQENQAIGCGGLRPVDAKCAEIKRMFVRPDLRRRGWARQILRHLEEEAHHRGFFSTVLETGCDNVGAIALYESEGYSQIPEYPGCQGILVSRCFIKRW